MSSGVMWFVELPMGIPAPAQFSHQNFTCASAGSLPGDLSVSVPLAGPRGFDCPVSTYRLKCPADAVAATVNSARERRRLSWEQAILMIPTQFNTSTRLSLKALIYVRSE